MAKNDSEIINIFTIGFTKKTAREFFELLRNNKVKKVIDIRLNNVSQLAGFSKKDDLEYFLRTILDIDYIHMPLLAPTEEILDTIKNKKVSWAEYEKLYMKLIIERKVEKLFTEKIELDHACLLCSEDKPEHCHRSLLAEYLKAKWKNVEIVHI